MIYIVLGLLSASLVWMLYEIWRAPIIREIGDDQYKIVRKERKISDLFKKL